MSFYQAMEKYYDDIFPLHRETLVFLEKTLWRPGRRNVLDLACGTGSYALALAARGFDVTGIDLDETMIELASQKVVEELPLCMSGGESGEVTFLKGDMLKLSALLQAEYDGAFCIGNSLVHLVTTGQIEEAVKEIAAVLCLGAKLVVQIVNYDRILKNDIKSLPTLQNKERGVSFERLYSYDRQSHRIDFTGILKLPDSTSRTNTIPLYPLRREELEEMLAGAGFAATEFYGSFGGGPWSLESPATVIVTRKAREGDRDLSGRGS